MNKIDVLEAHKYSSNHIKYILDSEKCGCFCCLNIFHFSEISEWIDAKTTAICPKCGIDSVLPSSKVSFDIDFLNDMKKAWFSEINYSYRKK